MLTRITPFQFEDTKDELESLEKKLDELRKKEEEVKELQVQSMIKIAQRKEKYEEWVKDLFERIPKSLDDDDNFPKGPMETQDDDAESSVVMGTEDFVSDYAENLNS